MAQIRLDKFLSDVLPQSRKEIKQLLAKGRVQVAGKTEKNGAKKVTEDAAVTLDGEPVLYAPFVYLMMNKPAGVVSATFDKRDKTVIDLLPEKWRHFAPFPVGRLDIDTEGLLLLTNDGQAAHRLLSPKNKVPKTYFARVDAPLGQSDIDAFREGFAFADYHTLGATLEILEGGREALVTIYEGKFHQVKKMFLKVGKTVLYLKRVSFAGLPLPGDLAPGAVRQLTPAERKKIGV